MENEGSPIGINPIIGQYLEWAAKVALPSEGLWRLIQLEYECDIHRSTDDSYFPLVSLSLFTSPTLL